MPSHQNSSNHIRSSFLNFFKNKQHELVPSSPLLPHNDPSLMFVNAGMVQFKNAFTGAQKLSYSTATSSQKCVRAGGKHNDLENVGYTARHHTFFEMLGNFSFGDYFKDEAIEFAWNFLTKELGINKDRLYVTIYHTDEEARKIWQKIAGLSDDRIIKIKTDDNFWSMGDVGPCGPCSEIFYDHGEHVFGGLPGTKDEDGDRFVEIWNLVFMQYEKFADGSRSELPKPSIDTGAGLERLSAVMQNVCSNYETDYFQTLIAASSDLTKSGIEGENIFSHRVISDHIRSICFLIADGVMPSNEGRGYVLRRIMRRAMRHVYQLGCKEPVLHQMLPILVNLMGKAYPELTRAQEFISSVIYQEESKFYQMLGRGLNLLSQETSDLSKGSVMSGKVAFKLYDTYGFPLDLTTDVLKSQEISVNSKEFEEEMSEQKARAKKAWVGSGDSSCDEIWFDLQNKFGNSEFLGYGETETTAKIIAIIDSESNPPKLIQHMKSGQKAFILFSQTPFYAESGGQIGDVGTLEAGGVFGEIIDTKKFLGGLHASKMILKNGEISVGNEVELKIDKEFRNKLRCNHSATHILHKILQNVLGGHVIQKGSLVTNQKLRFDFSHPKSLTKEELLEIECKVNHVIRENHPTITKIMNSDDAIKSGAMALFGEKYDDEVRVVSIGLKETSRNEMSKNASIELCGGTHVERTGEIGLLKITSESAIASGIRRIEAVTADSAFNFLSQQAEIVKNSSKILKSTEEDLTDKIAELLESRKKLEKKNQSLEIEKNMMKLNDFSKTQNGDSFLAEVIEIDIKLLRNLAIELSNFHSAIFLLINVNDTKISYVVAVSKNLQDKYDASDLIKKFSEILGVKAGGGSKSMAQAGAQITGNSAEKIKNSIDEFKKLL